MYSKFFKKQKMMRTVLISLIPIIVYAVYAFGWRILALLAFNVIVASVVEYISEKTLYKKSQVTEAAFVTATLFTLTLPPQLPFWMSGVGVAVGIFFGKEVFGGFGRNVFNPALVGRAFIYINFPTPMLSFSEAANNGQLINGLGGLTKWATPLLDQTSGATPMNILSNGGSMNLLDLFLGTHSGAIGEISKLLILLGAAYMIYKKVASWEIMSAVLGGFVVTSLALNLLGAQSVLQPHLGLLSGGLIFGAAYMATDPISAPKQKQAKWIYGVLIGAITVIIRSFSLFPGGMMFAILIASVFSPLFDYIYIEINKKKRLAKKAAQAKAQAKAKEV